MLAHFTLLFRKIVLFTIFLVPIFSFSQLNQEGIVIDSSMVAKPTAIPIISIIQKIEEANEEIKSASKKLQLSSSVIQIDSLYPNYVLFIKKQEENAQKFIKLNPNRQKVDNLIEKWDTYYGQLNDWESTINEYVEGNIELIDEISFDEQTWELTYLNASEEKVPSEVLNRAKKVWNDLKKTKRSVEYKNNDLLELESKINKQKIIVNKVVEDLIALKNSEVYKLFYLRHAPLWKTSFRATEDYGDEKDEVESISSNISAIFKFIKTTESNIYLYLVIVVLIILLINLLKKSFEKYEFNEQDEDLQKAKYLILDHSLISIIFLSLIVGKLFFTNTPTLFNDSLILVILIVSVPLVQGYMYKRFKKIIYLIILFYILDTAKTYIWFTNPQYRIYLLVEALMVIAILILFTHPYLETRKMKIGKFGLLLIKMTPVIYILSIISIVSNILGYTNLTDITLKICIQSGIITIIFYGILMIAGGISTGLIHRHFGRKVSFDTIKKFTIEKRLLQIIRVIVFIFWFLFFLGMIDLLVPLTELLTNILTETYKIGSVSFTIGAILTFILILTFSFLITRFISFLFDGAGISYKNFKLPKGVPAAISLVIRYFIIAFGFILALSSLGLDLSKFNLMAGALGLGIGFGLQTVISNFVSGLILVFERPILPGDTVEVNNLLGTVNRIGVRSSNIRTFDGAEVVVPNNNLIANDLINWTLSDNVKRVEILIGTTYGSDPNEILKILVGVAKENKECLKNPPPMALFSEFGESSLNFKLLFWVHYEFGLQAKSDVSIGVYNRFKELGIEIPFPQQDVYIKDVPKQIKEPLKKDPGTNENTQQ